MYLSASAVRSLMHAGKENVLWLHRFGKVQSLSVCVWPRDMICVWTWWERVSGLKLDSLVQQVSLNTCCVPPYCLTEPHSQFSWSLSAVILAYIHKIHFAYMHLSNLLALSLENWSDGGIWFSQLHFSCRSTVCRPCTCITGVLISFLHVHDSNFRQRSHCSDSKAGGWKERLHTATRPCVQNDPIWSQTKQEALKVASRSLNKSVSTAKWL